LLHYFRINDPYRLIIIFIALILFRLPFLISATWDTLPELSWMIIGERTNEGALLYVNVWDDLGPLSAWAYRILDLLFGRSHLALQVVGMTLFFFQIFFINFMSLRHKMFNENNYLVALFYGLLSLIFFNIITLSPQLMGLTFVLFSINHLFNHIETRNKTDGNLLNIGLYVGIASLFYLPFIIMIFVHIIGLTFFTNTIRRRYLLLLYGIGMPFIITWLIYLWYGAADELLRNYYYSLFDFETANLLSLRSILILGSTTIFLFLIAAFKILSAFGYTIFQVRIQKIMFFAAVVTLFIYTFYSDRDGYSLIIFLPWIAFFLSHFFIKIKNSFKREVGFFAFFLSVIIIYSGLTFHLFQFDEVLNIDSLMSNSINETKIYSGKKTVVFGEDIRPYAISKQATPYFNWKLSKDQLENLNYYDNLEAINKNLRSDMPDYIIDQIGLAPKIFDKIPLIGSEYVMVEDGIYKRKNTNN